MSNAPAGPSDLLWTSAARTRLYLPQTDAFLVRAASSQAPKSIYLVLSSVSPSVNAGYQQLVHMCPCEYAIFLPRSATFKLFAFQLFDCQCRAFNCVSLFSMHKFGKAELLSNEQLHILGWLRLHRRKTNAFGLQRHVLRWRRWEVSISQIEGESQKRKGWCGFTNIRRHQTYRVVFPQIISRLTCTVRNKFMNGPKFLVLVYVGCILMWCYRKTNPPATLSTCNCRYTIQVYYMHGRVISASICVFHCGYLSQCIIRLIYW